jgi:hypothetical protein
LTSYLSFEIARQIHKPDENITFLDFLNYTPACRAVIESMDAATPGKEFVHPLWYPLSNIDPSGQDEIDYGYKNRHLIRTWEDVEKELLK